MRRWILLVPLIAATPTATTLYGGGAPRGETRGTWTSVDGGGARFSQPAPGYMDVWLPEGPHLKDGEAHADLVLGPDPRLTLLVRSHLGVIPGVSPGDLEPLSAIGLTVMADKVQWERWDSGVSLPLAPPVPAPGLGGARVQVAVRFAGDRLEAEVFREGQSIATTTIQDRGTGAGRVGIRSQGDTASVIAAISAKGTPVPASFPGDRRAPLGEERLVLYQPERVPPSLRGRVLGRWPWSTSHLVGILVGPSELDVLARTAPPDEVRQLVPHWAIDPDFRASNLRVPRHPDGRPDLDASYKDAGMVEDVLRTWARLYPEWVTLREIGRSHQGRPIYAMRLSRSPADPSRPAVLVTGATHGSELLSIEYALDAARQALEGRAESAWAERFAAADLWVVPLLNPDGTDIQLRITRFGGRKNARDVDGDGEVAAFEGVDLNRNFPLGWGRNQVASRSFPLSPHYRGPAPASEPETRALMALADEIRPIASLSFHTNGTLLLAPYTLDGYENPTPNSAWSVAEHLAARAGVQPSGKALRVRRNIYPVDGVDQDWLRHQYGTVALLVEGSHHNPTQRDTRLASVRGLRSLLPDLMDRVARGPTLSVQVVEADGRPEPTPVVWSGESRRAGESWGTAPSGWGHWILDQPGERTITVPGHPPTAVQVDGRAVVRIRRVSGGVQGGSP